MLARRASEVRVRRSAEHVGWSEIQGTIFQLVRRSRLSLRSSRATLAYHRLFALALYLAHDIGDDARQVFRKIIDLAVQAIDFTIQLIDFPIDAVDFALDPVEWRFDRGEVVTVAAGLFEDVARDHLLALDLAFDDADARLEFFTGHLGSPMVLSSWLIVTLARSAGPCGGFATEAAFDSGLRRFACRFDARGRRTHEGPACRGVAEYPRRKGNRLIGRDKHNGPTQILHGVYSRPQHAALPNVVLVGDAAVIKRVMPDSGAAREGTIYGAELPANCQPVACRAGGKCGVGGKEDRL
jgi:hypothetical protein